MENVRECNLVNTPVCNEIHYAKVPSLQCNECNNVPQEKCWDEPREKCLDELRQTCNQVPKKMCWEGIFIFF